MDTIVAHELTWVTASPLWKAFVKDREKMRRPALLRFTSDAFMQELFALLEVKPEDIASLVATPDAGTGAKTLKFFQPVHGHFHLAAASLVCQLPGLPDHRIDAAREEKAFLVLRRLSRKDPKDGTRRELAWVPGAGPANSAAWQVVDPPEAVATGEELIPMFPASFMEDGKRRHLLLGLIPTSSRETFHAAEVADPSKLTNDGETVVKPAPSDPPREAVLVPKLGSSALYVIRCVYLRPRCKPPEPAVISEPTARFALASYFDPDAPARPIRIPTPADISQATLTKFKKNVGFVLSNQFRKKLSGLVADPKKTLDGEKPLAEDSNDTGEVWTFSIPIVTMVAMILLMVIVMLLNIFLGWIAFVRTVVPIKLPANPEGEE